MTELRIERVDGGVALEDWRYVHNAVIPTATLSLDETRERAQRNHLEVAYLGDVLVGCTTVRPSSADEDSPAPGDAPVATLIARVLPAHRGQGLGEQLYASGLAHARKLGAEVIETVVLASNVDGVRFAEARAYRVRATRLRDPAVDIT
jgi:GNAT superfamily N-acetyltransferase